MLRDTFGYCHYYDQKCQHDHHCSKYPYHWHFYQLQYLSITLYIKDSITINAIKSNASWSNLKIKHFGAVKCCIFFCVQTACESTDSYQWWLFGFVFLIIFLMVSVPVPFGASNHCKFYVKLS